MTSNNTVKCQVMVCCQNYLITPKMCDTMQSLIHLLGSLDLGKWLTTTVSHCVLLCVINIHIKVLVAACWLLWCTLRYTICWLCDLDLTFNLSTVGDTAALLIGHRTCDLQIRVLAGHHRVVALNKLLAPVCTLFGWEGNHGPNGR